jgi:hypothetical protein
MAVPSLNKYVFCRLIVSDKRIGIFQKKLELTILTFACGNSGSVSVPSRWFVRWQDRPAGKISSRHGGKYRVK